MSSPPDTTIDDLIALIGDAPIVFWTCPTHPDAYVEWDTRDDQQMTPRCVTCGTQGNPR